MSRYELFDRSRIQLRDLAERGHDLNWRDCAPLQPPAEPLDHPEFPLLTASIREARAHGRPVIVMMGGHPIKLGLSRYLIDLMESGMITHLAINGSGIIHDFELALAGGTSENVAKWIKVGQFGLWRETSRLNDIIAAAARQDEGIGEAVGRIIEDEQFQHRELSLAAAGWRTNTPVTIHVGVGNDIIHGMANCDGAALGKATYTDFLIFARSVLDLEGGVYLNVGTAVTGPEVYLKALSMARNVARQDGLQVRKFTTAVFDLAQLPPSYREGPPSKEHAQYYYRPWKTILVRTVADGGTSYYFAADHRVSLPSLWQALSGAGGESE